MACRVKGLYVNETFLGRIEEKTCIEMEGPVKEEHDIL
jgi:hypothetical protein